MSHDTTSWTPYIVTATSGRVLLGARVALFIDAAVLDEVGPDSLTPSRTAQFLAALEVLLSRYDSVVGRVPPVTHAYQGRSVVEVAHLPGAAGLAHHGRAGFAAGPAFLRESLLSFDSPTPFLHHVFGYEAFRNYIFPESFTPPFKYSCLEGPECWGWWNQGFVNIMGCLLCSDCPSGVGFSYFGHSSASFRAGMESHLLVYLARIAAAPPSRLTFEDVFLHERLPWAQHQSLDNLYSGILSQLFTCHGGARFLAGLFRCIPHLASRLPTSTADHATASENMMLACSAGAQCSLVPFFEGLGFPLRQEAKDLVPVLICACAEGSV
jgi:hypothetical protein